MLKHKINQNLYELIEPDIILSNLISFHKRDNTGLQDNQIY